MIHGVDLLPAGTPLWILMRTRAPGYSWILPCTLVMDLEFSDAGEPTASVYVSDFGFGSAEEKKSEIYISVRYLFWSREEAVRENMVLVMEDVP